MSMRLRLDDGLRRVDKFLSIGSLRIEMRLCHLDRHRLRGAAHGLLLELLATTRASSHMIAFVTLNGHAEYLLRRRVLADELGRVVRARPTSTALTCVVVAACLAATLSLSPQLLHLERSTRLAAFTLVRGLDWLQSEIRLIGRTHFAVGVGRLLADRRQTGLADHVAHRLAGSLRRSRLLM